MGRSAATREFQGLTDCLLKITKHDGFFGLYRGFLPSLQFIFIYRSAYYGLFDVMKEWTVDKGYAEEKDLGFIHAFLIGQLSAFVASMVSYPVDTVRRRLTLDSGKTVHTYKGTLDCTKASPFLYSFFITSVLENLLKRRLASLLQRCFCELNSKHWRSTHLGAL